MLNSDIIAELLHLNDASSVYTRESLGNILDMCNKMLESETLSAEMRGSIADIDAECCRLIRNRLLLSTITRFNLVESRKHNCSFSDVFAYCCSTVDAICKQTRNDFTYSNFPIPTSVPLTSDHCCLIILLPIAIMLERNADAQIRIIAAMHNDCIKLTFTFSDEIPDFKKLADECSNNGGSNGLFFEEPLMAKCLIDIIADCNAVMSLDGKTFSLSIPTSSESGRISSPSEPYIDNRFSLPYIVLSRIVKREI